MKAVILKDNQPILRDLDVRLYEGSSGVGVRSRSGSFLAPHGEPVELKGKYRIELSDGRSGEILIPRTQKIQSGERIDFVVSGPLE